MHVESTNVGVSPRAWTRAELDEEMTRTRARPRAGGWAMGRYSGASSMKRASSFISSSKKANTGIER